VPKGARSLGNVKALDRTAGEDTDPRDKTDPECVTACLRCRLENITPRAVVAYIDDPERAASLSLVMPRLFLRGGVSEDEAHRIGVAMIYEPETYSDTPLNDPELFTHLAKWRDFHATDRRTLSHHAAALYLASRRMDKTLTKLADRLAVPLHLMTAGEEGIVDNEKT